MTRPMPGPPEDCYCRFGNATCQECETRGYPYSWGLCPGCVLHNGRSVSHHKRLTDAECTAHYWQALAERLEHDADVNCGYETPDDTLEHRAEVWHRFAHTPHALEEA